MPMEWQGGAFQDQTYNMDGDGGGWSGLLGKRNLELYTWMG